MLLLTECLVAIPIFRLLAAGRQINDNVNAQEPTATCTSQLSCANESSGRSFSKGQAGCDILGIVGSVCMCGIPLVNGFIDMPTPEQVNPYLLRNMTCIVALCAELRHTTGMNGSFTYPVCLQFCYYLIIMMHVLKHGHANKMTGGAVPTESYVDFACR